MLVLVFLLLFVAVVDALVASDQITSSARDNNDGDRDFAGPWVFSDENLVEFVNIFGGWNIRLIGSASVSGQFFSRAVDLRAAVDGSARAVCEIYTNTGSEQIYRFEVRDGDTDWTLMFDVPAARQFARQLDIQIPPQLRDNGNTDFRFVASRTTNDSPRRMCSTRFAVEWEESDDPPPQQPSVSPTRSPVAAPSRSPVAAPSRSPIRSPTDAPSPSPTASPLPAPTFAPLAAGTPTRAPVVNPTQAPVVNGGGNNNNNNNNNNGSPSRAPSPAVVVTDGSDPDNVGGNDADMVDSGGDGFPIGMVVAIVVVLCLCCCLFLCLLLLCLVRRKKKREAEQKSLYRKKQHNRNGSRRHSRALEVLSIPHEGGSIRASLRHSGVAGGGGGGGGGGGSRTNSRKNSGRINRADSLRNSSRRNSDPKMVASRQSHLDRASTQQMGTQFGLYAGVDQLLEQGQRKDNNVNYETVTELQRDIGPGTRTHMYDTVGSGGSSAGSPAVVYDSVAGLNTMNNIYDTVQGSAPSTTNTLSSVGNEQIIYSGLPGATTDSI